MSHNDDAKHWYHAMSPERRAEYNRKRAERRKAERLAKARSSGLSVKGDAGVCECCGKEFILGKANQRFCSLSCRRKVENRRLRAKRREGGILPDRDGVYHMTCRFCGKAFTAKQPYAKFCSNACSKRARYKKKPITLETRVCVFCGKEFVARTTSHAKYCSNDCCSHARHYATLKDYLEAKAAREKVQAVRAARREKDGFGLTMAERNAVIRAQCGSRDELWAASQSWSPAQRKFAKARWDDLHPTTSFTPYGKY